MYYDKLGLNQQVPINMMNRWHWFIETYYFNQRLYLITNKEQFTQFYSFYTNQSYPSFFIYIK